MFGTNLDLSKPAKVTFYINNWFLIQKKLRALFHISCMAWHGSPGRINESLDTRHTLNMQSCQEKQNDYSIYAKTNSKQKYGLDVSYFHYPVKGSSPSPRGTCGRSRDLTEQGNHAGVLSEVHLQADEKCKERE